ncbi:MAG: nitroreductase family protein [Lachnospiraceae bacterium]|nr:nitroreductase family protein [Lachnospiraceae bacterium]MBR6486922.1 nitroreductase family protein [Lachnospiraceae bacterium]
MEFSQLIESRRSIRKFKPGMRISEDQIKVMIDAAIQAPTWKNSQTGRYYVAMSEDKMNFIKNQSLPSFNAANCENAVAIIITAYETKRSGFERDGNPTNELGDKWGVYDLGLQNENLVLKARETGYDTLIMGIRDVDVLKAEFGIPDSQEIVSIISVGVREDDPEKPKRKAVEDITKFF